MDIQDIIFKAGIVGAGGAGFPTHIKLQAQTDYLLINGAECEPLIHCDKFLMRTRAKDIVKASELVATTIGASKIIFEIKEIYVQEFQALNAVINHKNTSILQMKSFYPAGDEQVLVFEATGKTIPIGGLPKDVGATICNVSTLCDIADSVFNQKNKTHRILSLLGDVEKPLLLAVPIGISVKDCITAAIPKAQKFSVLLGGPMMGRVYPFDQLDSLVVSKTINSIIVLPENHYLEKRQNMPIEHMINQANSACIQCRECTEMCPRFLIGQPLHPHRVMRNIAFGNIETNEIFTESLLCCECGVCDYACPMSLSPRRINQMVKKKLVGKKRFHGSLNEPIDMRKYRKLPTSRLVYLLGIVSYTSQQPTEMKTLHASQVCIPLKQHIGKHASACVSVSESVSCGQLIASVESTQMGANVHASIDGVVSTVSDTHITITTQGAL
ncbi:MAG: 4Fe-4S dicluster domain-containing protein [Treponemataceae bacterium]